jgi:hypothetical protein
LELQDVSVTDIKGTERLAPIFELWIEVNKILTQWTQFALKFDLEQRRVELEEGAALDIANTVLSAVLDPKVQLTQEQIGLIRVNLRKAMTQLAPKFRPEWAQEFDNEDGTIDVEEA